MAIAARLVCTVANHAPYHSSYRNIAIPGDDSHHWQRLFKQRNPRFPFAVHNQSIVYVDWPTTSAHPAPSSNSSRAN
eukprot:3628445-Rhodomonas_salina.1